jgi:hypothetical protein
MAGPGDIRSGKAGPIQVPATEQKAQAQVQKKDAKKVSPQDAARLAQQAGFHKSKRGRGGFDVGDSSQAPIPLPDDELDPDAWSQQGLDNAQQTLSSAGPQLESAIADLKDGLGLGEAFVEGAFMPTEKDLARLQALKEREPEPQPDMDSVSESLKNLFGVEFNEDMSVAERAMAVGLMVAGQSEQVKIDDGTINREELLAGLRKVTEKGNQSVGQAQKMNKGIDQQLNLQRTFVFKR